MPSQTPNHLAQARGLLAQVSETAADNGPAAVAIAQIAQAHATIAVAEELIRLRESVDAVQRTLTDPFGGDAGTSLHYIAERLERQ